MQGQALVEVRASESDPWICVWWGQGEWVFAAYTGCSEARVRSTPWVLWLGRKLGPCTKVFSMTPGQRQAHKGSPARKAKLYVLWGITRAAAEESRPRKKTMLEAGRLLQDPGEEGEDSEEGCGHKEGEIRRRSPQSSRLKKGVKDGRGTDDQLGQVDGFPSHW